MYESRLELARLQIADFASEVVAIRAQPFRLVSIASDGRRRTHVPDFALIEADGTIRIVNVKPAERLTDPKVRETLGWAHATLEARGFPTEVWTGADPILLGNIGFVAGYRNSSLFGESDIAAARADSRGAASVGDLETLLAQRGIPQPRPLVMHLLWIGAIECDLSLPLDATTELVAA